ncbi:unnamed protein product [Caenorhabditis nigoni]
MDKSTLTDSEGSGLQFINLAEGSGSNPIVARDSESSGLMYDEEGSENHLLFDSETPIQVTNELKIPKSSAKQ